MTENEIHFMIKKIPFRFAANTMLFICTCAVLFHILVLAGIFPYSIVWGGRIENKTQMIIFEFISILAVLLVMLMIGIKARLVQRITPGKIVTFIIYGLSLLFALNTIGNIFSLSTLEAILFTPVTLLACILCWRIASESNKQSV